MEIDRFVMTSEEFSKISSTIPTQPGIYKYYDDKNELLYVGKAKHLRKRVSSYFAKKHDYYKTQELVRRIHHIEFTIVNHEKDALLLEDTLIKEFRPLFNIELKDGKTYPFIIIKNERFPRIFFTRKKYKDGSEYYGPYTSVQEVKETLRLLKEYFPMRTCTLNLSKENIQKKKYKVCLEYHLGNCKGPCEGLQTEEEYNEDVQQIRNILKGNISTVLQSFKSKMQFHAENLEFEKAEYYKARIESLQTHKQKSTVVNTKTGTVDVFSILEDGKIAFVNYLAVNDGRIIQTKTIQLEKRLEETPQEVLTYAIERLRTDLDSQAKEIIVPFEIDFFQDDVLITVPKLGDKKRLLDLSEKNVNHFVNQIRLSKILYVKETTEEQMEALQELQDYLKLKELPINIECFDNSNFQGSFPVAAMVSFKNGVPSKQDYRKFNIKTIEGINDFGSMQEVVFRRYSRLKEENQPYPNLVIIDGGKGQLSAAHSSIKALGLQKEITLVGLAKRKEEIFFVGDTEPILLPWDSLGLKLVRTIRDEVHRFGITFHRNQRSKGVLKNELQQIPGIGKSTIDLLLKMLKSVKKIKEADLSTLTSIIGKDKASKIKSFFTKENLEK